LNRTSGVTGGIYEKTTCEHEKNCDDWMRIRR
jgi:hypothetical protein